MSDESIIRELQTPELTGESLKYHLLAEAIRRGAKMRPKCIGQPFYANRSCAIGAAFEATFLRYEEVWMHAAVLALMDAGIWPIRLKSEPVWHLNDAQAWTREAIADRLDDVAYGVIAEF